MAGFRIIAWLLLLAPPLWALAGDVAVVVNVKNPVIRLTMSDLRKVLLERNEHGQEGFRSS